jgi:hypothetical protein
MPHTGKAAAYQGPWHINPQGSGTLAMHNTRMLPANGGGVLPGIWRGAARPAYSVVLMNGSSGLPSAYTMNPISRSLAWSSRLRPSNTNAGFIISAYTLL